MTTPLNPQQDPRDQQDPHDPQDPQDPTRALEEDAPAPASGATSDTTYGTTTEDTTDDTAVLEDDASTQRVETGFPPPVVPASAQATWAPPVETGTAPAPPVVAELPRPTGPHAPAIVLGVVCLAIAILVIAQEVGSLRVDWGDVGPLGIVAAGAMLVLFGLLGLLTSRRNQA